MSRFATKLQSLLMDRGVDAGDGQVRDAPKCEQGQRRGRTTPAGILVGVGQGEHSGAGDASIAVEYPTMSQPSPKTLAF